MGRLLSHHVEKLIEERSGVMGTRCRLGVILQAEHRAPREGHALDGAVVEVHVRELGAAGQRVHVDGEAVVLRGDLDAARLQVLDRVVHAVVAELELVGAAPERQAEDLVAEADAEERLAAVEEAPRRLGTVVEIPPPRPPRGELPSIELQAEGRRPLECADDRRAGLRLDPRLPALARRQRVKVAVRDQRRDLQRREAGVERPDAETKPSLIPAIWASGSVMSNC